MTDDDALHEVLTRVGVSGGEAAYFSEQELAGWPAAALAQLKAAGVLMLLAPATEVECPGCEEACFLPVHTANAPGGQFRAFVACPLRDDVARVEVKSAALTRWQCTPSRLADVLARLLETRRGEDGGSTARRDLGVLRGTKHSAHVTLLIDQGLALEAAGHRVPLGDVLVLGKRGLVLERRTLLRYVDSPAGPAGDSESRQHRIERLTRRRNELKLAGVRNFNEVLAEEENCSVSLIKQLLAEKKPAQKRPDLSLAGQLGVQQKPKARR